MNYLTHMARGNKTKSCQRSKARDRKHSSIDHKIDDHVVQVNLSTFEGWLMHHVDLEEYPLSDEQLNYRIYEWREYTKQHFGFARNL